MQGAENQAVEALCRCDLDASGLPENERALLEFVGKVTQHAYRITDSDTQRLRELTYTDDQIAEAVYVAALFAMFNRVADAFGLADPGYQEMFKRGQTPPSPAERHR